MTSEVRAKAHTSLQDVISVTSKKPQISVQFDFSREISAKTAATNTAKGKDKILKQDQSGTPEVKPATELKVPAGLPVVKDKEEPVENAEIALGMQVQQIAINTLTVESKEDIPQIVLQEVTNTAVLSDEVEAQSPKSENAQKSEGEIKLKDAEEPVSVNVKPKEEKPQDMDVKVNTQKVETPKVSTKVSDADVGAKKADSDLQVGIREENSEEPDVATATPPQSKLDLGKVNIKVADPPIRAESPQMPQEIADRIIYNVDKGKHVFDIELFPENLGKVAIKMVFEKGIAQLVMTTHTDKAHKLLSQQLDVIRGILENNSQNQTGVEVKASENSSENFDKDSFSGQKEKERQERKQERKEEATDSFAEKLRLGIVDGVA